MKPALYTLLVCCVLFLMGCPLKTSEPIQGSTPAKVPKWLPGKWTTVQDNREGAEYGVSADKSKPGLLHITEVKDPAGISPAKSHPAMLSTIKGRLFVSIYVQAKSDAEVPEGYYHYSIECTNGRDMDLIPIAENKLPAATSGKELGALFARASPDIYLDRSEIKHYRKK
jgi:hypothetical protein